MGIGVKRRHQKLGSCHLHEMGWNKKNVVIPKYCEPNQSSPTKRNFVQTRINLGRYYIIWEGNNHQTIAIAQARKRGIHIVHYLAPCQNMFSPHIFLRADQELTNPTVTVLRLALVNSIHIVTALMCFMGTFIRMTKFNSSFWLSVSIISSHFRQAEGRLKDLLSLWKQ